MVTTTGPNRITRLLIMIVTVLACVFSMSSTAAASAESESEVKGTLSVGRGKDKVGVEGVTIVVSSGETEVGSATSDADGKWVVTVPDIGEYSVTLDESTLPEGIVLQEGKPSTVTVTLSAPGSKSALFALDDGSGTSGTSGNQQSTIRVLQLIVDGLKLGLIIAMCAVGLSLIYGTTGLVNFAHGEMVTLGAITAYVVHVTLGLPGIFGSLIFGAIIAVLVTGAAGGMFNQVVWKPLRRRGASLIAGLVVSIGFSIMFRYIYLWRFGGRAKFYTDYQIQSKVYVGSLFGLAPKEIVVMVVAVVVLVGVAIGLERTRAGKAMRAVADNKDLAESSGINVESVIMWVWIVGSALAGLGGVLFGVSENINWEMGFRTLLLMFAGITLGGLGTAYGALVGSLLIGVLIQLSTLVIPPDLKNVPALALMVIILLFRPQGIFGRAERIG